MTLKRDRCSGELLLYTREGECLDLWVAVSNGWPVGRVERVKRLCLREEVCK